MVANFWKNKDHETALQAFSLVSKHFPSCRFALVGRDWGTLQSSKEQAQNLDLEGIVDFVTDCTDPKVIIAASTVALLLSPHGEGISNSILEYMAMGRPVVATDCDGNRESVIDGVTGFLVPNKPEDVADRIEFLLADSSKAGTMGEAGRKRACTVFALDVMTKEYEKVFSQAF